MTKKEAKEITLEVWEYIVAHNLHGKGALPVHLYKKIDQCLFLCPLCEVFLNAKCEGNCPLSSSTCELHNGCCMYEDFNMSKGEERQKAAQAIVDAVKAWDVEVK